MLRTNRYRGPSSLAAILALGLAFAAHADDPEPAPPAPATAKPASPEPSPLTAWLPGALAAITREFAVPATLDTTGLYVSVDLVVAEGKVSAYTITRPSGDARFDEAAKRAIEAALPRLDPVPEGVPSPIVVRLVGPADQGRSSP